MKASMKSLVVMSFLTFCMFSAAAVFAQVPSTMTYNGFLMDNGQPANAPADVSFKLFDAENGGNMVWQQNATTIDVSDGRFSARLTNLNASIFNGQARWLEVTINGETLSPRSEVGSMPYSLRAGDAQTIQGKTPEQLGGGGGSGTDTLASLNCNNNQIALFNGGSWACTNMPVYTGTNFATSGQNCPAGQIVSGIAADGKVTCVTDKDTNTTYTGANFATSNQTCPAGQIVSGISATGAVTCVADKDTNTTYTAGTNISISGTTLNVSNNPNFSGNITANQYRYRTPREGLRLILPFEFLNPITSGGITWHTGTTHSYASNGSGTNQSYTGVAALNLPLGVNVTYVGCLILDKSTTQEIAVEYNILYKRSTSPSIFNQGSFNKTGSGIGYSNSSALKTLGLATNFSVEPDRENFLFIRIMFPQGTSPDLQFHGCYINYTSHGMTY